MIGANGADNCIAVCRQNDSIAVTDAADYCAERILLKALVPERDHGSLIAAVHQHNSAGTVLQNVSCKAQHLFLQYQELHSALCKSRMLPADLRHLTGVFHQFRILIAPRIAAAVERVFPALQASLVTIINAGDAGQEELEYHSALEQSLATVVLVRRQFVGCHPVLALVVAGLTAETVDGTLDVVGGDKVHQHIHRAFRIVFQDHHNAVPECGGSLTLHVGDDRLTERIVHYAVQLVAQEIAPLDAVSLLVGRILPDLADDDFFLIILLDAGAQIVQELVRQLICHVQTVSGGAQAHPVVQYAVVAADVLGVAGVVLVHIRQGVDAPPGLVLLVAPEVIPGVIRAVLGLISAGRVVASELVEIDAVCAGVGEYAVQNDGDAPYLCRLTQLPEVLVGTQQRVYIPVVCGVITVILVGFEDRVQIDAGDTQVFQIVQLAADAVQVAAEIVVVPDVTIPPLRNWGV